MKKIIGFGGENIVYKVDKDTVSKKPFGIRYFVNPSETVTEILADLQVLQAFFKEYLPPTKIVPYKNKFGVLSYTMSQKYIKGACLKKSHLHTPDVLRQLKDIMKINDLMLKSENKSYEFFGLWTLLFSKVLKRLSNIIVEEGTNKLYIIDIGVLYLGDKYHSKFLGIVYKWALAKQTGLLKGFF